MSCNYDISGIQLRSVFEWGRSRRVFYPAKKDCSTALSSSTCVCSVSRLPSEEVFDGGERTKKNYDYTAGQTSLVMGDEKSTLSVAERVKRVVLMVVSFYCLHLRTDTPEKEKEADLTDSVQNAVGPMPSVYLPSRWRWMKKTCTTTPFVLLHFYNYYCWFTTKNEQQ